MPLSEKVYNFTEALGLFREPCKVIMGVSGGADSICLLHIVVGWRRFGIEPAVVHVMHGIRGDEARRDANFVCEQCKRLNVPFYLVEEDVPALAARQHTGLEETGRQVRYAAFEEYKRQLGASYILTAHTASDQVETVLLNVLRGCGTTGLIGIRPLRDGIMRPLLSCTRVEVEDYCNGHNLSFIHDSTNDDTDYTRNALRHWVVPAMHRVNSHTTDAIIRLSHNAAVDEEYLESTAAEALSAATVKDGLYLRDLFALQHAAIRYRMLRLSLEQRGCRSMEERHAALINQMLNGDGGAVDLPGGYTVRVTDKHVQVLLKSHTATNTEPISVDSIPLSVSFGQHTVRIFLCSRAEFEELGKIHKLFFKYAIDYDTIQGSLQVRRRSAGERIHPSGRGVGKSLKSLMQELTIPADERDSFPVIYDEIGPVLLPGYCCDERVRVSEHTNHYLVCYLQQMPT